MKKNFSLILNNLKDINNPAIAGDVCRLDEKIKINNNFIDFWISTYLFGMNKKLLMALDFNIIEENLLLDNLTTTFPDKNLIFGKEISNSFKRHLQKWLFIGPESGWYKSSTLSIDNIEKFKRKITSIYLEKNLTERALEKNSKIIDLNSLLYVRLSRIIKSKFALIKKKLK